MWAPEDEDAQEEVMVSNFWNPNGFRVFNFLTTGTSMKFMKFNTIPQNYIELDF